jgi:hypothetical protein
LTSRPACIAGDRSSSPGRKSDRWLGVKLPFVRLLVTKMIAISAGRSELRSRVDTAPGSLW